MRRRQGRRLAPERAFGSGAVDPMATMANLSDVMLVFACGLMLALIINWNVDVSGEAASVEGLTEVTGVTGGERAEPDAERRYEELGVVYRDPETGRLYMVEKDVRDE